MADLWKGLEELRGSPEHHARMLARAEAYLRERDRLPEPTEEEVIEAGVSFILYGPGGD